MSLDIAYILVSWRH